MEKNYDTFIKNRGKKKKKIMHKLFEFQTLTLINLTCIITPRESDAKEVS